MTVETPLIAEVVPAKGYPRKLIGGFVFALLLVGVVALHFNENATVGVESAVGEFAVGEYEVGDSIGSTSIGQQDDELALSEGMFLPVEIDVNGEQEDASKIFWIGFTDDRKTKFNEQVTFKRHYDGPDCWSKWFNEVNEGKTEAKQVELFMHAPHEPAKLNVIKMDACIPTRWEAGGTEKPVEVITLTCQLIAYDGMKDKSEVNKKACQPGQDPRDCMSNEEYMKLKHGDLPVVVSNGNGPHKPKFQKCSCKEPVTTPAPEPSCGCDGDIVPVTHYLVQRADPRDYMKNEEHSEVYGSPPENSVSNTEEGFGIH